MADLSQLGNLVEVNPVELGDTYPEARQSTFQLPKKGEYTLQAPESFPQDAFGTTKAGHLSVRIDPTIVGPINEGFQLKFQSVSAKPFERRGQTVSQAGDYLAACGFRGTLKTAQQIADAIESTAGATYRANLDWRAYSNTGVDIEGMEKFPKLADGSYQSWVEDPVAKDDNGNPVKVRARLYIRNFIAA